MNYSFYLNKLETRSSLSGERPTYIVRGYATTPNNAYSYQKYKDKSFKEFFTEKGIENVRKKAKAERIFVDAEHITATKHSSEKILSDIQKKTGADVKEALDYVKTRFKFSDLPMFKVEDVQIDDKGLFVDIRGNPFYREIDEEHKQYFDAVWGSLESGFINGLSLNFRPTSVKNINSELTQIDDVDVYGISLTGNPANEMATITEVAMRSIESFGGDWKCQKKRMTSSLLMQ